MGGRNKLLLGPQISPVQCASPGWPHRVDSVLETTGLRDGSWKWCVVVGVSRHRMEPEFLSNVGPKRPFLPPPLRTPPSPTTLLPPRHRNYTTDPEAVPTAVSGSQTELVIGGKGGHTVTAHLDPGGRNGPLGSVRQTLSLLRDGSDRTPRNDDPTPVEDGTK